MNPQVRELTREDAPAVREFFGKMPAEDRTFFYQDVDDPAVIEAWAADDKRVRRCAVDDSGRLLALAALQPGLDWTSHVADLVLLVSPEARGQHLGRTLARAMLVEAVEHGFLKVTVMIAADDSRAIEMFTKMGFAGEALLRDQLRNPADGSLRDAVVLAHLVHETWASMASGGFENALL
jgi:ribosomal protein S18 acetylase RimI-like enzyme